jgi:hypothetical protein
MARAGVKFPKGWKKVSHLLDPKKGGKRIQASVDRMTQVNGRLLAREMRARISRGAYGENAELTAMIKGSRKALKGTPAALTFKAIAYTRVDQRTGFVGVLRRNESFDVARVVHEGATIPVTRRMRNLFRLLWMRSMSGRVLTGHMPVKLRGRALEIWDEATKKTQDPNFFPLKPDTTAIVLPPRKFVQEVVEDPVLRLKMKANWTKAIAGAVVKGLK